MAKCPHRNFYATLGMTRCTDCGMTWAAGDRKPLPPPPGKVIPFKRKAARRVSPRS